MAALLKGRDINSGDTVSVFTTNSPEMVVTLYALSKLGAVAAMINTNLRGMPIAHLHEALTDEPNRRYFHPLSQRFWL
jgi:acyl-CoA synthetase (AMP-forming)/AMP-acid ligase II